MFMVINKSKVVSYFLVFSTVVILFFVSVAMQSNSDVENEIDKNKQTTETVAGVQKELPIYSVKTEDKKVALTINCAWNADDIDKILEVLEKNNVKVTFFMVGNWVEKYPEAVKKVHDAGHEIGNHSFSHPHVNNLSQQENENEILKCSKLVKAITGEDTNLYRAPYGEYNNTVIKSARNVNHEVIQWSLDTLDYQGLDGNQMWDRLSHKLSNGSIILMHNGTEHTADSLELLITNIKNKGYEIVKVSDLIFDGECEIDSNGVQNKK